MRTIASQKGVALITALFFLVMVSALAAGAIMLATVQVKVAGGMSCWETAYAAAEAGEAYAIPLLVGVNFDETVPAAYGGGIDLVDEKWNDWDSVDNNPDLTYTLPDHAGYQSDFTVNVDIDPVGTLQMAGFSIEESIHYHKGMADSGQMTVYHFTSMATNNVNRCSARIERAVLLKAVSR